MGMRWKSHIAIAKALSQSLGLPKDLERALSQGSVEPDKQPDLIIGRRGRKYVAPHHNPPLRIIMNHVWNARLAYLNGDNPQAMKSLGRVLHYIQDKSVSKGFLGLSHGSREHGILFQVIPEKAIQKGISMAISSPQYVKTIIKSVEPKKNIDEIMYQACMCSAIVAKSILGSKNPSKELVENFKLAKERYRKRTIPIALGISTTFLFSAVIVQNFWLILLGALAGYIIQRLDTTYHNLKEEVKWFGIK